MLPEKSGGRIVLEGECPGGLKPGWEKFGWEMSGVENVRDGKYAGSVILNGGLFEFFFSNFNV